MKASELIKELQELIEAHGDCEFVQCPGIHGNTRTYKGFNEVPHAVSIQVESLSPLLYGVHKDGEAYGDRVVFYIEEN